ncbi:M3 family oligoendopeptidase [Bdellovibrio bacteriovorus]|uniref:M3 family oligoendopeptidase n=1 Tax=Bdellovibrio bacteriovorus TaxID=959 RepID=UPI0035A628A9
MEKMAWNIESEYPSYNSVEFQNEFDLTKSQVDQIEKDVKALREPLDAQVESIQKILVSADQAQVLLANMSTYLMCHLSVDSSLNEAQAKKSEVSDLMSRMFQALVPVNNFVKACSDETLKKILSHPELVASDFLWAEKRSLKPFMLSDGEETLLQAISTPGLHAWGELYGKLSGSMRCELKYPDRTETVGLAQAAALTRSQEESTRRVAWSSIQQAWTVHKESAAAILNALAGWRHEENKKRSHTEKTHYLDQSLFYSRITRDTLEAMLSACYDNVEQSRKAPLAMAKLMGKKVLDPWDLLAQSPISASKKERSYEEGLGMIKEAFAQADSSMSDFVGMMADKSWIEARVLPNKRNGAYCTGFQKRREPRVFMTYMGSNSDISTLAHELGHAYHSWVMRDMPRAQTRYPMTLAETASIFSETLLHDVLLEKAQTREEKIEFAWGEIEGAASFLLNIPARFDFEKSFYDKREKRTVSSDELTQLTDEAWTKWYGPTLSANDKMFWATKLHFAMSGISFYNYPYTFGYLFSMSVYARRQELGKDFMKTYINILRDTGRMSAEDLVQKHLGEDIRRPEFWKKSIAVINRKISDFEKLALS